MAISLLLYQNIDPTPIYRLAVGSVFTVFDPIPQALRGYIGTGGQPERKEGNGGE